MRVWLAGSGEFTAGEKLGYTAGHCTQAGHQHHADSGVHVVGTAGWPVDIHTCPDSAQRK